MSFFRHSRAQTLRENAFLGPLMHWPRYGHFYDWAPRELRARWVAYLSVSAVEHVIWVGSPELAVGLRAVSWNMKALLL